MLKEWLWFSRQHTSAFTAPTGLLGSSCRLYTERCLVRLLKLKLARCTTWLTSDHLKKVVSNCEDGSGGMYPGEREDFLRGSRWSEFWYSFPAPAWWYAASRFSSLPIGYGHIWTGPRGSLPLVFPFRFSGSWSFLLSSYVKASLIS